MADSPNTVDLSPGTGQQLGQQLGQQSRRASTSEGFGGTSMMALGLSLSWLIVIGGLLIFLPSGDAGGFDGPRFVMAMLVLILPVGGIWIVAIVTRSIGLLRQDQRRLQVTLDAMRQSYLTDRQIRGPAAAAASATVERKMNDIALANRAAESALVTFSSSRELGGRTTAPAKPLPQRLIDDQPTLALGTAPDETGPPLARNDLIRALNFPDTDKDDVGFAALRRALKDRQARQLVQASQDVLTLLSQDGIYMDDLRPDRAKPEIWRRFANGERGRAVAALGGIRDRSCLAISIGRMREDTIFRDAAHHFLRLFDRMLISFERDASDEEIADLSETRTARAFMLLGRVTGAFD